MFNEVVIAHLRVYYQYLCRDKGHQSGKEHEHKCMLIAKIAQLLRASLDFD
jgi:hypothetical protein